MWAKSRLPRRSDDSRDHTRTNAWTWVFRANAHSSSAPKALRVGLRPVFSSGVYFEANGHGTVVFKDKTLNLLKGFEATSEEQTQAKTRLLAASKLLHPVCRTGMRAIVNVLGG